MLLSLRKFSCSSFALSLGILTMCVVVLISDHHGGLMYGWIFSMVSVTCLEYCLTRCSRLDIKVLLFVVLQCLIAFSSHVLVGCFVGSVWMRVRYFVICLCNSSSIERSSVLYCRTIVDVVLKYSMIVFMTRRCIDIRLFT